MLRLNLSVKPTANPNRLGVLAGDLQGFPNGRRLTDDVVDIELQALEGAAQTGKLVDALAKGDAVNANDNPVASSFPYLALPNVGAVNKGGGTGAVFREMRSGGFARITASEASLRAAMAIGLAICASVMPSSGPPAALCKTQLGRADLRPWT